MKANEFVKLVGLAESKRIVRDNEIKGLYRHLNVCHVDLLELESLVESHELVEKLGGLVKAREVLNEVKARNHKYAQNFERPALEKAINDVESCGGERG